MGWHSPVNTHDNSYNNIIQDGEEVVTDSKANGGNNVIIDQQTVTFVESASPELIMDNYQKEEVADNMAMDKLSLQDFLSRPVLVKSIAWDESNATGVHTTFFPWYEYFNDTRIKYKLNNWAFIKCTLRIKAVFNASPFYYGAAMACYHPLYNIRPSHIHDDSTLKLAIPYSQLKKAMIYPQHCEGFEMSLPFFYPASFLHCAKASEFQDMGKLTFLVLSQLQSATGVTGTGISVNFYAWAEDVVLSGPTVGLSMQDGDEYGVGPVSRPASAIANFASRLGDIPIIGPFATATSIGARAVSQIAKLFGYTNVPVIEDQKGVQPRQFPPVATTEIGYPFEKLTIDSKNELTIDHRSVGLEPIDELAISTITRRESYLTSFNWSTSDAHDDKLFTCAVTPQLFDCTATANSHCKVYMTPMCFVSSMFKAWRGDIIFRFRIICSQYHKGRIRISYDPDGYAASNLTNASATANAIMTEVIDISEQTDVEMRIPFQQYIAWCGMLSANNFIAATKFFNTSSTFEHVQGQTNGSFIVQVVNKLSAPVVSSTISVLVFVRGAENLEFANPIAFGLDRFSPLAVQDGEENLGESDQQKLIVGKLERPMDHLYLTYMGERVASLRTLLRRQCFIRTVTNNTNTSDALVTSTTVMNRLPSCVGFSPNGLNTAKGLVDTVTTYQYNWVKGNFLSHVYPCFVANRGSVNWTVGVDPSIQKMDFKYALTARDPYQDKISQIEYSTALGTPSVNTAWLYNHLPNTGAGGVISAPSQNMGINFQMPFYSPYKFTVCEPDFVDSQSTKPYAINDYWRTTLSLNGTDGRSNSGMRLHLHAGIGTDFDLLYFLFVPTYINMVADPTPV